VSIEADGAVDGVIDPLFAFAHVSVRGAAEQWRLHDVNGSIPASGITALVGPSGSGKSTLLRCCNRLEVPDEGTISFRGSDIAHLDVLQLRRRVSMVFQRPTPFPGTGLDNLRTADPTLDEDRGRDLLARVQLGPEFLDRDATQLSGGEAQRLCLARSLAVGPEVVLMDEVTSSLDPVARHALEDLARSLADDGIPIVWVTHDLGQARRVADAILVVVNGHIADSTDADAFTEGDTHDD
jgi:putative ABC transport system ATP-binding protein